MASNTTSVMKVLVGLNLPEHEGSFRGIIDMVEGDQDTPSPRQLVIASVGVLMQMGNLPWPVIMKAVRALNSCSDERLQQDGCGVAIINGSVLLTPSEESVDFYGILTLHKVEETPQAYVTTVYTVASVWDRVIKILNE